MRPFYAPLVFAALVASTCLFSATLPAIAEEDTNAPDTLVIHGINPPAQDFFTKELNFHGIPIQAGDVVSDEAMREAYRRLAMLLTNSLVAQPWLVSNLVASGVELHIIGQHQVTSDLPEFRDLKGKPLPEYNGLTIDQRTRGMGGKLTSCGEENLLRLNWDHYVGRDICAHEFSHAIRNYGLPLDVIAKFDEQYHRSLAKGLWVGAYSASNPDEYFAELTMWYFGTHGDLHMTGAKPENGTEGFKKYDPEAYALFDDFYQGRIHIGKMNRGGHEWTEGSAITNQPDASTPAK